MCGLNGRLSAWLQECLCVFMGVVVWVFFMFIWICEYMGGFVNVIWAYACACLCLYLFSSIGIYIYLRTCVCIL